MSDNEYYSDSDNSEKETSDNEEETPVASIKKPLFKPSIKMKPSNENDIDDSEIDDADDAEDEDDDDVQMGGVGDFADEDDVEEDMDNDDDDEDSDIEMNEDDENPGPGKNGDAKNNKHGKPKKTPIYNDDDNEYDDDDEYDENYLQKFDSEIMKNYVNEFHPECLNHNYDEIAKLSVVVKNSDGIIIDPLHRTIPYLTKYERARVLGQRAKQIETGAKPFVKVPENIVDSYIIAELELKEKKIPFIIRRPVPGGGCEYWNIRDLEQVAF